MKIKEIVFEYINSKNGNISLRDLDDEILAKKPDSKWQYTHWNWYKYHITSEKGKFFTLFSDEIKKNLKSIQSYQQNPTTSRPVKTNNKSSSHYQNFKFLDRTEEVEKDMANILAKVSYHIHPSIVEMVVKDNYKFKLEFEKIAHRSLNLNDYFFDGSDCLFPGIRRSVNKEKIDTWKNKINDFDGSILNDNTFTRHLWTFLSCNKCYSSSTWKDSGLNSFELAHIFSHKTEELAFDNSCFHDLNANIKPYALFTSASNTVIIPKGLTKPTDKSKTIKLIFFKRYLDLYENIIQLPHLKNLKENFIPEWYNEIKWNEPFLPTDWEERINNLLDYRKKVLKNKYEKK